MPSAASGSAPEAVTAPAGTAPAASTVFSADTNGSQALKPKTPTKAALKLVIRFEGSIFAPSGG